MNQILGLGQFGLRFFLRGKSWGKREVHGRGVCTEQEAFQLTIEWKNEAFEEQELQGIYPFSWWASGPWKPSTRFVYITQKRTFWLFLLHWNSRSLFLFCKDWFFLVHWVGDYKEGYYIGVELPEDDPEPENKPFYGPNVWPAPGNQLRQVGLNGGFLAPVCWLT